LEYLCDTGEPFRRSAEVFASEAGLEGEKVPTGTALLERKW
jgi:hypothetical protein